MPAKKTEKGLTIPVKKEDIEVLPEAEAPKEKKKPKKKEPEKEEPEVATEEEKEPAKGVRYALSVEGFRPFLISATNAMNIEKAEVFRAIKNLGEDPSDKDLWDQFLSEFAALEGIYGTVTGVCNKKFQPVATVCIRWTHLIHEAIVEDIIEAAAGAVG